MAGKYSPTYSGRGSRHQARSREPARFQSWRRGETKDEGGRDRMKILSLVFLVFGGVITVRLFVVQVLNHSVYEALASGQHELVEQLFPERGEILAQDPFSEGGLSPLAANQTLSFIYANPKQISQPAETAEQLAPLIGMNQEVLEEKLSKADDPYEPLLHKANDQQVAAIEALELSGIHFTDEIWRYYPEKSAASHITGFVGIKDDERVGQYGLEGEYNKQLAGEEGMLKTELDSGGRFIAVGEKLVEPAQDGDDYVLSIDKNVQYAVCARVKARVEQHSADQGAAVVLDPNTGYIIAMCSYPDFDPNEYNKVDSVDVFINTVVSRPYEVGSIMKPITMSMALDQGKVTPETTYTDTGVVDIGGFHIRNSDGKAHGVQTMVQVLDESLNTGAIFAAQQVGEEKFLEYMNNYGFGQYTTVELPYEQAGDFSSLEKRKAIYMATASYGQGVTATMLQMGMAYATIANGGTLMESHIIKEVRKSNGYVEYTSPKVVRQVISSNTATTLAAMMVSVVENGHGKRAQLPGYYVAGKTGTAQVAKTDGTGYDSYTHIGSFAGFFPVSDPKFVIITRLDNPRDVQFAESSAAPLFSEIGKFLINYYHVPPDRE